MYIINLPFVLSRHLHVFFSDVSQPGGTFSGQVHSKIDRPTELNEETRKPTDKPSFRKQLKSTRFFFFPSYFVRQNSSFEIGIVRENVDKVLYHPVAEIVLLLKEAGDREKPHQS